MLILFNSKRSSVTAGHNLTKLCIRLRLGLIASRRAMASSTVSLKESDYSRWSNEQLIERVKALESRLKYQTQKFVMRTEHSTITNIVDRYKYSNAAPTSKPPSPRKPKQSKAFDASKYSTRLIALKFAYLGQNYNGLEHHANNDTPLPTVEEELWKALYKAKLISPTWNENGREGDLSWEGCEYSKCGRTDRGVSALGQVVGIRVRSNRPLPEARRRSSMGDVAQTAEEVSISGTQVKQTSEGADGVAIPNDQDFHSIKDELPYAQILNRLLPPDIRILAWCPNPPPDFSARFSCKERRYKYFFTNPAFTPTPLRSNTDLQHPKGDGWLDIQAMRIAASKFTGLHDFRNLCKVDASKQLDNFERRIFHADIEEVNPDEEPAAYISDPAFKVSAERPHRSSFDAHPRLYTFTLHGSAFLWHQVRHMVAVLFLIGQGLEPPSIMDDLLDVKKNPCKPHYEMADGAPLVLWDCIFPSLTASEDHPTESRPDALDWVYVGDEVAGDEAPVAGGRGARDPKFGICGLVPDLWKVWRKRKMDEVLAGSLLNLAVRQGQALGTDERVVAGKEKGSQKVFLGGDSWKLVGKYVPLMERERMEDVDVINERYRSKGKGGRKDNSTGF